jgi:hypothetical protein
VSAHLGATYVLSGAYVAEAGKIMVTAELSEARNNHVVWTDRLNGEIGDLLRPESELADRIAQAVHLSVLDAEVEHILTQPLPTRELLAAAWQHQVDAPLQQGGVSSDAQNP